MISFWDCTDLSHPTVETKKHYGNHGNQLIVYHHTVTTEGDQFQEIHHVCWPG